MQTILMNTTVEHLSLDTFEKVIDLMHPLFIAKLTGALALVALAFFFLMKKVFRRKKEVHTWLPITLPERKLFTDFSAYMECIRTMYRDCNREIIEKMVVAQEVYRALIIGAKESTILGKKMHEHYILPAISILPSLEEAIGEMKKEAPKIVRRVVKKIKKKSNSILYTLKGLTKILSYIIPASIVSTLETWMMQDVYEHDRTFLRGEIRPVRGSPTA